MDALADRKFRHIRSYTTREQRKGEKHRETMHIAAIKAAEAKGELCQVKRIYEEIYALNASDVARSQTTSEFWMTDLDFDALSEIKFFDFRLALIVPESEVELIRRMHNTGRQSRMKKALSDFRSLTENLSSILNIPQKTELFCNTTDKLDACVGAVYDFAMSNYLSE
jgi:guanylate kinase